MSIVYFSQFNLLSTDYLPSNYNLFFQHTGQVSSTTIFHNSEVREGNLKLLILQQKIVYLIENMVNVANMLPQIVFRCVS